MFFKMNRLVSHSSYIQILLFVSSAVCSGNIYNITDDCYEEIIYDVYGSCKGLSYDARVLLPERICRHPSGWPYIAEEELEKGSIQPDFLEIRQFGDRGRGIITNVDIPNGSYVIYYHGKRTYKKPNLDDETYLFSVRIDDCVFWIDGSTEDGSYSRLLNDNHIDPNLRVEIDHKNVLFYADRDIRAEEELTFDYGLDPENYPWRHTDACYDKVFYDTNGNCKHLSYDAHSLLPERICRHPSGWPYIVEEELEKGSIQPDFLEIRQFGDKGRGITTKVDIPEGSYVIYYHGKREYKEPELDDHGKSYLFAVHIGACTFWIDASKEDTSYARIMNDDHINQNLRVEIDHRHVLFFANRDIKVGEELTFDYGLTSDEYPWRQTSALLVHKYANEKGSFRDVQGEREEKAISIHPIKDHRILYLQHNFVNSNKVKVLTEKHNYLYDQVKNIEKLLKNHVSPA